MQLSPICNEELSSNRRKAETITAYVTPALKEELEIWANEENRSISSLITHLLSKAVEERQKKN